MKVLHRFFALAHGVITILFVACAVALVGFAIVQLWQAFAPNGEIGLEARFSFVLEGIGLLTISVAALELGQTILEEEVQRRTQISIPTRIRRFLSRFMIVVIVSLAIEFLVATFDLIHHDPSGLPFASTIGFATAALLAAWGLFIRLNRSAEELEPESIDEVRREDDKIEGD